MLSEAVGELLGGRLSREHVEAMVDGEIEGKTRPAGPDIAPARRPAPMGQLPDGSAPGVVTVLDEIARVLRAHGRAADLAAGRVWHEYGFSARDVDELLTYEPELEARQAHELTSLPRRAFD